MNNSTDARKHLAQQIGNGAVLIHSGKITYRNNDTWYPFRQDSNFYYLTEWPEPEAHAVIVIKDSTPELHLFVQDRNEEMETWDGKRIGQEGALEKYNATKAYSFNDYQKELGNLLEGVTDVYCDYSSPFFEQYDRKGLAQAIPYDQRGSEFSKATLHSLSPLISELRLLKIMASWSY